MSLSARSVLVLPSSALFSSCHDGAAGRRLVQHVSFRIAARLAPILEAIRKRGILHIRIEPLNFLKQFESRTAMSAHATAAPHGGGPFVLVPGPSREKHLPDSREGLPDSREGGHDIDL